MSNDLLLQILNELKELKAGQAKLEIGQAKLEEGQAKLEKGQAKLEASQAKLEEGQAKLEVSIAKLEAGQQEIRRELSYIWSDIKRLDKRLSIETYEITCLHTFYYL